MTKEIIIGGVPVQMKATAFTPFQFKAEFGEDLIKGMQSIPKTEELDSVFMARVAWIMAKGANPDIEPLEEWLEQFGIFDLYEAFPKIIELWGLNNQQHAKPRKK